MGTEFRRNATEQLPSVDGFQLIVSVGPEREPLVPDQDLSIVDWEELEEEEAPVPEGEKPLSRSWRQLRTFLRPLMPRTKKYKCGHRGPKKFLLRIWGRKIPPHPEKREDWCPNCKLDQLTQKSIQCCLCGFTILPGEGVAIYDPGSVPKQNYPIMIAEGYALGCMMWDCCPSGGFFGGHWNGKGVNWYSDSV